MDVVLKLKICGTSGEKEISKIRGVSMEVRAGEIVVLPVLMEMARVSL